MRRLLVFAGVVIVCGVGVQVVRALSNPSQLQSIAVQSAIVLAALLFGALGGFVARVLRFGNSAVRLRSLVQTSPSALVLNVHIDPYSLQLLGEIGLGDSPADISTPTALTLVAADSGLGIWRGEESPQLVVHIDWRQIRNIEISASSVGGKAPPTIAIVSKAKPGLQALISVDGPLGGVWPPTVESVRAAATALSDFVL